MIKFKFLPQNFNYLGTQYNIVQIDNHNYVEYTHLIHKSIENFNAEIQWDNMFDFSETINRFENGMTMYIGLLDNEPFGHVWFNRSFLFNLFVRNKIEKKKYTGKEFISCVLHEFYNNGTIYCEVDEWNTKSIKLFERLGFQRYVE